MDISLILILIGILVGIYIIFKIIKKVIFAILTVVLLLVVVVGSVFGLVYLDFNQLSSQQDFNVNLIYIDNGNYSIGANFFIKNNSKLDLNSFKELSSKELSNIKVSKINKKDKLFVITINNKLMNNLLINKTFSLKEFNKDQAFNSFNLNFKGYEIYNLLNSNNTKEDFINLLLFKNNITGLMKDAVKPVIENQLNKFKFSIKEILFLSVIKKSLMEKTDILKFLKAYKNNDGLNIYPDRITFKLVRILPINMIDSYLPQSLKN